MAPPALMFLLSAAYTFVFYYPLPYYDHWDIVPLFEAMQSGALSHRDLFKLHGDHWHASGYMVLLALAAVTDMAHWAEACANLLIATVGFVALARIITSTSTAADSRDMVSLAFAFAAFFYFSLDQAENWLWGWQVALFVNVAGALWCIEVLSRGRTTVGRFVKASIAAVAAIYGFATGWLLVPIGYALIVVGNTSDRKRMAMALAAWTLLFFALLFHLYKSGLRHVLGGAEENMAVHVLLGLGSYTANFIASGITFLPRFVPVGLLIALVGVGLFAAAMYRISRYRPAAFRAMAPLVALVVYGAGAAGLTALGRWSEFGAIQAMTPRYISLANFFWLGVGLTSICAWRTWPDQWRLAVVCTLVVLCVFKALNMVAVSVRMTQDSRIANEVARDLQNNYPESVSGSLQDVSFERQDVNRYLRVLYENRASLFRNVP